MGWEIYDILINKIAANISVHKVQLGLNWSFAQVVTPDDTNNSNLNYSTGLCFSPTTTPRILDWPGTLTQRKADELAAWLKSWDGAKSTVALAVINAVINADTAIMQQATLIENAAPGHLKVFAHFQSAVQNKKIAVIGRYPGLDKLWENIPYHCIERVPQAGELPDFAAEFILPESDWVFITASSIANKSIPRLLSLARDANIVLMGPSLPWLMEWKEFGVNYLAGVKINSQPFLEAVVAEGGGTRLFDGGVEYSVLAI